MGDGISDAYREAEAYETFNRRRDEGLCEIILFSDDLLKMSTNDLLSYLLEVCPGGFDLRQRSSSSGTQWELKTYNIKPNTYYNESLKDALVSSIRYCLWLESEDGKRAVRDYFDNY